MGIGVRISGRIPQWTPDTTFFDDLEQEQP
jgi:hypothetical protein